MVCQRIYFVNIAQYRLFCFVHIAKLKHLVQYLLTNYVEQDIIDLSNKERYPTGRMVVNMKKEEKQALIAQMEEELLKVCGTYEDDCSKCPKQALCNEYIRVSTTEEE